MTPYMCRSKILPALRICDARRREGQCGSLLLEPTPLSKCASGPFAWPRPWLSIEVSNGEEVSFTAQITYGNCAEIGAAQFVVQTHLLHCSIGPVVLCVLTSVVFTSKAIISTSWRSRHDGPIIRTALVPLSDSQ